MPKLSRRTAIAGVLLFSLCCVPVADAAHADPTGRVARLSHSQGEISYSPAGEDEWVGLVRNRPLIRGDRLWTDHHARGELQVGSAALRLGSDTSLEILQLDDRIAQFRLTQGTINLRVRRMDPGQIYEIATPFLAFNANRPGRYRIDVDPPNHQTTIIVWEGAGEAFGENASFPLRAGDTVRFHGADLRDHDIFGPPRQDAFDRYSLDRDRRLDRSVALRYVDDDLVGYADLDDYGSWRSVPSYGDVWFPNRVDAGWAPYRDGHWVWQEPWGWTWVDHAPWGFAPFHYGRWVSVSNYWGWIPVPRHRRSIYAPALVAFIGGRGWSPSFSSGYGSSIGWFPLGPRDVYVPCYQASRDYFTRINGNNTVINNTIITDIYNNYARGDIDIGQVNHVNRSVSDAITAVPGDVFKNSRSVRKAAIRLDGDAIATGDITSVAPITPGAQSVIGAGKATRVRPPDEAVERRVVARHAPPLRDRPFATREPTLRNAPGRVPKPSAVEPVPATNIRVKPAPRGPFAEREHRSVDASQRAPERSAIRPLPGTEGTPRLRSEVTPRVRVIPAQRGAVNARADGFQRRRALAGRDTETTASRPALDRGAGDPGQQPTRTRRSNIQQTTEHDAETQGRASGRSANPRDSRHLSGEREQLNQYRREVPNGNTAPE